jgi:ribosomal protein S18 acetylase RimI-like enzyme
MDITLRAANPQDYEFLYNLHRETLKEHIDQTWGWDEAWQQAHFQEKFDISGKMIIECEGVSIGCIAALDEGDHIFLSYIALKTDYQRRGIGTQLIEEVLASAAERKMPVILKVLRANPARTLYERMGFIITNTTETHHFMRAAARGGPAIS